jgi:hypothetical protein
MKAFKRSNYPSPQTRWSEQAPSKFQSQRRPYAQVLCVDESDSDESVQFTPPPSTHKSDEKPIPEKSKSEGKQNKTPQSPSPSKRSQPPKRPQNTAQKILESKSVPEQPSTEVSPTQNISSASTAASQMISSAPSSPEESQPQIQMETSQPSQPEFVSPTLPQQQQPDQQQQQPSPMSPLQNVQQFPIDIPTPQNPLVQMTMAQMQMYIQQGSLPQQLIPIASQDWEYSQTQSPISHAELTHFLPQHHQPSTPPQPVVSTPTTTTTTTTITRAKTPISSASTQMPIPRYHPTIAPLSKPTWLEMMGEKQEEAIYPTSLIWSCNDHYHTPLWAKVAHSAMSLHAQVIKDIHVSENIKARFREMPSFRQIPVDGLNQMSDVQIFFQTNEDKTETFHIKINAQTFDNLTNRRKSIYVGPLQSQVLMIPSNIFNRFIIQFHDVADTQLHPAANDVQQENHNVYRKQLYILNFKFLFSINIRAGHNGLERIVDLTIEHERHQPQVPISTISFPWVRMTNILMTLKEVLHETQERGLL